MDIFADIFRSIAGKVHFMIYMGKAPAAEIFVKEKQITVKIINPIAALGVGVEEFLSRKGTQDIEMISKIKESGYTIKMKFKSIEVDL